MKETMPYWYLAVFHFPSFPQPDLEHSLISLGPVQGPVPRADESCRQEGKNSQQVKQIGHWEQINWSAYQCSSSLHSTVVSSILTTKVRSFIGHKDLSGHPICPVVDRGGVNFCRKDCRKQLVDPLYCKAYIPLRHKNLCVGSSRWLRPPMRNFTLEIPTCWYLKMLKFALPPTRYPNVSQWNIGCVGSQTQNSRAGHVHFFFLCVDFIRVGSHFSVDYGLKLLVSATKLLSKLISF